MSSRQTVLIVEPDTRARQALSESLAIEGFRVIEASDLATARRLIPSERLDAVIVDYRQREGTGLELVREASQGTRTPMGSW